ncbi:PREDICTED: LOW QUALITY PROTEIN: receptor-like protein kinase ANXUR2 [Tarenaya hassleriana]|uniref:LOW QUALITY PROTEIN: receptor-like protein kinase ANXUR2 n=1 Tax=Tarenaya hassleriana TaxID=28532 RepID=UPI00053C90BA|nr:PREDICTED: LOW QUALITY PROTEIN: receptor-like protein kinase ANXUR2 [Tarenaya hassleriana]
MNEKTRILVSLLCFTILLVYPIRSNGQNVALSCGASEPADDSDKRKWEPDAKFLKSGNSIQAIASYQDPSLLSTVPYMTARIFTSPTTYEIPVKGDKRHYLRFHFYPSTYTGLDISNSYFSVTANDVALLSNFSAAITCQALTQAYLVREYSLAPTDKDVLSITFTPSDKYQKTFAFINGIEVIEMPELFDSAVLVGFSDQTADAKIANLQTMFRLNVGGQDIPGSQDAGGLIRTWYNDAPYIFSAGLGVTLQASDKFRINYQKMPVSTAPADVYKTARSQGPTGDINIKSNLTWMFQVDTNFTYIMRLHFCEFQLSKINQKVFNIYINNKTAQADPTPADIIAWTGEKGVPTYKDYAMYVDANNGGDEISLQMTPSALSKPEYLDSQLNGLEIFKMDSMKNLAGPNPEPSPMQANAVTQKEFRNDKKTVFIIGSAIDAGGVATILAFALCFTVYQRKRRFSGSDSHTSSWLPIYGNSHTSGTKSTISGKSNNGSHLSNLAAGLCRRFSLSEIKHGTHNFDESNVIGVGGFGKVYKGVIDGNTKVAIKRSNPNSEQGINEFETEIELLSRLRHKHLVSLIGYCEDGGEMCLIYDYMALGTLREHLYNTKKPQLTWKRRLEIAIGAARGLHYLHTGAKYTIIHRDVKTTNILLDENWVAKVSDFGLSKTGPDMNGGHVTTVVKGSFGYLDPEYFRRQQLTEKSDVYSFGVVLFEILCARPALNPNLSKEQVSLADWALNCKKKGTLEDIIDPNLKGKINPECLRKFADTAEKCLSDSGVERPTMGDVLWNLEFALQLQETSDGSHHRKPSQGGGSDEFAGGGAVAVHVAGANNRSEDHDVSDQSSDDNSGIFSQIINPKGR